MQIFKFQRRSYKLTFRLFPPRGQSAPETLLAGLQVLISAAFLIVQQVVPVPADLLIH